MLFARLARASSSTTSLSSSLSSSSLLLSSSSASSSSSLLLSSSSSLLSRPSSLSSLSSSSLLLARSLSSSSLLARSSLSSSPSPSPSSSFFARRLLSSSSAPPTDAGAADAETPAIHADIDAAVKRDRVVVFMKGVPDAPKCGFSNAVVQILNTSGVEFVGYNVLDSDELRAGIKTFTEWPTIPQVFVDGEFVGGADIVMDLFKSGELETMLKGEK